MCHGTVTYRIRRIGAARQAFFPKKSAHGHKKSETFTDHKTADRMESGQRNAFFRSDLKNNPDTSDTRDLLDQLAEGRDERVLLTIIVAVDTGVDTTWKQ